MPLQDLQGLNCALAIAIGALVLAGIIWGVGRYRRKPPPTTHALVYPQDETSSVSYTYNLGRADPAVWITLRVEVASGMLGWTVTDPDGLVRWQGRALGGQQLYETRELSPVVGTWTARLDLVQASGHYDLRWAKRRPGTTAH